jgi:hypothetical protein
MGISHYMCFLTQKVPRQNGIADITVEVMYATKEALNA